MLYRPEGSQYVYRDTVGRMFVDMTGSWWDLPVICVTHAPQTMTSMMTHSSISNKTYNMLVTIIIITSIIMCYFCLEFHANITIYFALTPPNLFPG